MFNSLISPAITLFSFLACMATAIVLGVLTALVFSFRSRHSSSFTLALALLPAAVTMVIIMVNGNIGAGVAVAGAFSLVRFRSAPGNSREIAAIFLAMAVGLANGMGYVGIGGLLVVIVGGVTLVLVHLPIGRKQKLFRDLKVTIPENLDYEGIFDDLFAEYTTRNELRKVRTVNMGSLYELHYHLIFREDKKEKEFLDSLRCRNGNLTVVCGRIAEEKDVL